MTIFHPFPHLPPELRLRIWDLTVEPRTVDFRIHNSEKTDVNIFEFINDSSTKAVQLLSSTPPPATLQACHESRNHLQGRVYEQIFYDIVNPRRDSNPDEAKNQQPDFATKPEQNGRYIYISFPTDTLDIDTTLFFDLSLFSDLSFCFQHKHPSHPSLSSRSSPTPTPLASKITRLKFTRNFGDEYLDRWEIKDGLTHFVGLKEVFCVCEDGIMAWDGATEWIGFENLACGKEGVWLINGNDGGRVRRAVEWDRTWEEFKRERERERERQYGGGGGGYW